MLAELLCVLLALAGILAGAGGMFFLITLGVNKTGGNSHD